MMVTKPKTKYLGHHTTMCGDPKIWGRGKRWLRDDVGWLMYEKRTEALRDELLVNMDFH